MIAQDKFKALGVDDAIDLKAFKGHCKIELTDVNTGKVEVIEHDNMVTKALEYFFKKGGITNPSALYASSIRSNPLYYLLGGVMCLDTALTEDAEIVRVPTGVTMTANGARDVVNAEQPTELGTYNSIESGWQNDGSLKMVWDWSTSQGNGTINSVCLSSIYGGMLGIGNGVSQSSKANAFNPSLYNSPIGLSGYEGVPVGIKDNVLYCVQSFYGVTEYTVKKYAMPYTGIDVRDSITARLIETITVPIPNEVKNIVNKSGGAGMMESYFFKDDIAYVLIGTNYDMGSYPSNVFTNDDPIYIIKYNIATGSVTAQVLNTTNTGISYPLQNQYSFYFGVSDKWAIIGNNAVDLSNLANVNTLVGLPERQRVGTNSYYGCESITSDTFLTSQGAFYIDAVGETGYPCNEYSRLGCRGSMQDNPLMMFGGNALYRDPRYIATIFNLDSPKVKDASKMMKVTYILRFS